MKVPKLPYDKRIKEILIDSATIRHRVTQLAVKISEEYNEDTPLLVVGILKGSFIFLADLCRELTVPHQVDFIALSSYGVHSWGSGAVRMIMDLKMDVKNRHILVVEDISDTGYTLDYLFRNIMSRGPASVKCCSFLSKPSLREVPVQLDYLGFEIEDMWVVGYGLDYKETYRTLPFIARYNKEEKR